MMELMLMGPMCSAQEATVWGMGQIDRCFQDTDRDDVNPIC